MSLGRLAVTDFRNIESVDLRPASKFNFVEGCNGSGKTSLLEAIHVLAMGRSFRTRKFHSIIRSEQPLFALFAEFVQHDAPFKIGITREQPGKSLVKLNGKLVVSAAELAQALPLQVINAQSFLLLEGGPAERRHFLDWMVFHVKHGYRQVWSDYSRCLKQRNSILRSGTVDRADQWVWDEALCRLASQIDEMRSEVIDRFLPQLSLFLENCGFIDAHVFRLEYLRGWKAGLLQEELHDTRDRDLRLGFTGVGPHKADIKIRLGGRDVAELLSRGQQKSLITAMYMAQLNIFKMENDSHCVLLIDDLPAELDQENQQMLCRWLSQLDRVQCFITGIDLQTLIDTWPLPLNSNECKVFHVKHGQVTEQPCDWSNPHDR
jgi:DNA replication and repair protein RecF